MQSTHVAWVQEPSTGNVISRTIATYRANFLSIFGLAAIINVPLTIWSAYVTLPLVQRLGQIVGQVMPSGQSATLPVPDQTTVNQLFGVYGSLALTYIAINFLLFVLVYSVTTYVTSEYQFGRQTSLIEAFRALSGRLPIYSVSLILVIAALVAISYGLAFVLFLCGFGFGLIMWLAASLVPFLTPVFMLERTNIGQGISRAFSLGKLHLWPVVRISLLLIIANVVIGIVISYVLPDAGTVDASGAVTSTLTSGALVNLAINGVLNALLLPLFPIAFTIMYYDARVRYEGLDAALTTVGTSDARPADVQSPPAGPLFERRDVSNILIMTMIMFGLLVCFYVVMFMVLSVTSGGL